jgi:hypothetical protein
LGFRLKRAIVVVVVVILSVLLYIAFDLWKLESIDIGLSASEVVARMGRPTDEMKNPDEIGLWTHTETERGVTKRVMVFDRDLQDLVVGFDAANRVIWTHRGQLFRQPLF